MSRFTSRGSRRRLLRALALGLPSVALAGCFGGAGEQAHGWWELEAPGEPGKAAPDAVRAQSSLVVEGVAAGALIDGTALLFSRNAGMRAAYQYASWTERPAARLARLAQRRLQARGGFRDVSLAEAGVAPDLLLTLTLDSLHHDLVVDGGALRLEFAATLIDWHTRRPVASQAFSTSEPTATADAAGAVAAAGRATARLLDALAPWVESHAAGAAAARAGSAARRARADGRTGSR